MKRKGVWSPQVNPSISYDLWVIHFETPYSTYTAFVSLYPKYPIFLALPQFLFSELNCNFFSITAFCFLHPNFFWMCKHHFIHEGHVFFLQPWIVKFSHDAKLILTKSKQ